MATENFLHRYNMAGLGKEISFFGNHEMKLSGAPMRQSKMN